MSRPPYLHAAIRIVIPVTILVFSPVLANAVELSRPDLMSLARAFVKKVGQKLPPNGQIVDSQNQVNHQIPEGELLLLTPRLSNNVIVDGTVGAMERNGVLFIAFNEFATAMAFPIVFSNQNTAAKGWYIQENYPFDMDLTHGTVQSRNKTYNVTSGEWFSDNGTVYISAESIRQWMHIDYTVNWESQLIDLAADVPFPLEGRLERRKRKLEKNDTPDVAQLPRAENPPRLLSLPTAQVNIGTGYTKSTSAGTKTTTTVGSLTTSGDMLGHTTRTILSGNNTEGLTTARLKAERKSEDADLLGPLHAKHYEAGDISPVEQTLSGDSSEEWGARVTNADDNERIGSTKRTIEGDIPAGWDVELYNQNQLIGFQTANDSGRYQFQSIDLYAGDNDFRLVFYGPQGEVREEQVSIPVNLEAIGANRHLYDISATLNDVHTYDKLTDPDEYGDRGTPHIALNYEQGIADGLTVGGGLRHRQVNGVEKTIASGDVIARLGKTLLNTTVAMDEKQESAIQIVTRRSFGKHSVRSTTFLATSNFNPDVTDSSPLIFQSATDAQGPLVDFFGYKISYTLNATYNETADGTTINKITAGQNAQFGSYTVGHSLKNSIKKVDGEDSTRDTVSTFFVRRNIGATRIRAGAQYVFYPESELDLVNLSLSRNLDENVQGQLEIEHRLNPAITTLTSRLNWSDQKFVLSPSLVLDTNHDIRAMMNLRFGLVPNEFTGKTKMTRDLVNNQGAVFARVFFDQNGNDKFDDGDTPIEGAVIKSLQSVKYAQTDTDGNAFMTDLPEFMATDITLENSSLGNPYYISTFKGLSVYPRPGAPVKIDFPVHLSGELDGTIYKPANATDAHRHAPVGGVHVQLINNRGVQAFSTLTAYDGYYVLSLVPPGTYLLRIDPKDLKETGLRQPWPRMVTIGYDGKVMAGQNITLESGIEIPIDFTLSSDQPLVTTNNTQSLATKNNDQIAVTLGTYRSTLLSALLRYRIQRSLAEDGLGPLDIQGTDHIESGKKDEKILVANLPPHDLDRARQICNALVSKHLTCGLKFSPDILFLNPILTTTEQPPTVLAETTTATKE